MEPAVCVIYFDFTTTTTMCPHTTTTTRACGMSYMSNLLLVLYVSTYLQLLEPAAYFTCRIYYYCIRVCILMLLLEPTVCVIFPNFQISIFSQKKVKECMKEAYTTALIEP